MQKKTTDPLPKPISWAKQSGLTRASNGCPVFGLNPNLNIEDEYIQNLLKQVHFMNLQVKLLKEKQQQSAGNSLWGIINRSTEPLVKNIVDSNQKFQTMKKQVDGDLNKTEYDNVRLADHQQAILTKMDHLQKKIETLQQSRVDASQIAKNKEERMKERIDECQERLQQLQNENKAQNLRNHELLQQYEALLLETERQQFASSHDARKIRNDEQIELTIETDRSHDIQTVNQKIALLTNSIESSQQFQIAKQHQSNIRDSSALATRNIATAEFELLQLTESIRLAQREKEKEVMQRKKLMEQYESLKVILSQILTLNATRMSKEIDLRKRESVDIHKGEYQTKKLEKNLEQIRKKLTRSEQAERGLRQDVEHMEHQLAKLKEKREQLSQTVTGMTTANDQQDTLLSNCRNEYRRVRDQSEKIVSAEVTSVCELNEIQSEVVFLRQRKEYLSDALSLKETLNQTKLEELQKVVQKNKDVNETVTLLMEKWEQIKTFSKI